MSLASPMTWLLVTTMPDESMMKPEPSEFERARRPRLALSPAALAAAVEEFLEQVLERRALGQLRQGAGRGFPRWWRPRC